MSAREVMQSTDDCRLIREKASDGSPLWDVEVDFEDDNGRRSVLTIGCDGASRARALYGDLSHASHITFSAKVQT